MTPNPLTIGDRVCFEGHVTKYGRVDALRDHAVHVTWEEGGPPTWLSRQRVYFAPDEEELQRRAETMKSWKE